MQGMEMHGIPRGFFEQTANTIICHKSLLLAVAHRCTHFRLVQEGGVSNTWGWLRNDPPLRGLEVKAAY